MKIAPQTFSQKMADLMRTTGKSYHDCAAILGRRGGLASGRNRRSVAWERRKQEAQGIR